jgi:ATP-dependent Clp protease ATP-binding subunit ClpC
LGCRLSEEIKQLMFDATFEAKKRKSIKVFPEHVLLTFSKYENESANKFFVGLNIDRNEFVYEIKQSFYIESSIYSNDSVEVSQSLELKKIFEKMRSECDEFNCEELNSLHLVYYIFKFCERLNKILYKFDFDLLTLKNMIMNANTNFIGGTPFNNTNNKNKNEKFLKFFCDDITEDAFMKKIDPVVGREEEIDDMIITLSRRKKNNVILVGEAGVGKTAIVEGLAQRIVNGDVPDILSNKKILSLNLTSLIAGTKYRGEFEERMLKLVDILKEEPDTILFIDEIHTIVGAGNVSDGLDVSNIIKPSLARGEIQVIGATTLDEYRKTIENDKALTRRFKEILVNEPSNDDVIKILHNIKEKYEEYHGVEYDDEVIELIVNLSDKYITYRSMPDKAIDVMDEIGSSKRIKREIPKEIKNKEMALSDLIKLKEEAIINKDYEKAAEYRDKEKELRTEIEEGRKKWFNNSNISKIKISKDDVYSIISKISRIPVKQLNEDEITKLKYLEEELKSKIISQDEAIHKVSNIIINNKLNLNNRNKPIASLILRGPTGVGKTYLAKNVAKLLFGDEKAIIRFDMSEFMEKFNVSRLIGAPPGYVGYDKGGELTEKVRKNPYSVILFDEIEKAHRDIYNILLQILDDGYITDASGRKINFKNTLIFMTTNVGVKEAVEKKSSLVGFDLNKTENSDMVYFSKLDKEFKKYFRPEFINRIDSVIDFNPLSKEDLINICKLEVNKFLNNVRENGYNIKISDIAMEKMVDLVYDPAYGARPIDRGIREYFENTITKNIIEGNVVKNKKYNLTYSKKSKSFIVKEIKTGR